ncbi:MAG: hypothetical protein IPL61_34415 [Myxococcales bacterium]|nr:hypothetical protein [Myxococcales bacterium]
MTSGRLTAVLVGVLAACGENAPATSGALALDPPALALPAGREAIVTAIPRDDSGALALSAAPTWTVRDPAVLTITPLGGGQLLLHGAAPGSTVVTATIDGADAAAAVTVTTAAQVGLTVTPATAAIRSDECVAFTANARYSDGTTAPLDPFEVDWAVSGPRGPTPPDGVVCPVGVVGTHTVWATHQQFVASAALTVARAPVVELQMFVPHLLLTGTGASGFVLAVLTDGSSYEVTRLAAWSSSAPDVASVDGVGGVHGHSPGTAIIATEFESVRTTAPVEIVDTFPP